MEKGPFCTITSVRTQTFLASHVAAPPRWLRTTNPHPVTPRCLFLPTLSSAGAQIQKMGSASSDQSLALFSVNVARDSNYQRGISPGGSEQVQTHASQLHPGLCNDFADCSAVWILPAPSWERKKKNSIPKRGLFGLFTDCMFIMKGVSKTNSPKRGLLSTSYVLYGRSSGHWEVLGRR